LHYAPSSTECFPLSLHDALPICLAAVAVDPGRAAVAQEAHEDRDHAGLAVRLLAGAVDVAEAERDVARPVQPVPRGEVLLAAELDRKSTRLNSSHDQISYAVFCL